MKLSTTRAEEWRVIPPYPNYEVSSRGRVRRCTGGRGAQIGHMLLPKRHKFGYPMYDLSHGNRIKREGAHRLIALAFLGPAPSSNAQAAHDDGDPTHNEPSNIRWASARENAQDKYRHGTQPLGERHPNAKLSEESVREIRRLRKDGLTYKQLSERFGVAPSNICAAVLGRQWGHVDSEEESADDGTPI